MAELSISIRRLLGLGVRSVAAVRRRRPAISAAIAVLLVTAIGLSLVHRSRPLPLTKRAAVQLVLHDQAAGPALKLLGWDRVAVGAVDAHLERVVFYQHDQIVFQAAVRADGRVTQSFDFANRPVPYGNSLAYKPALLIGLSILFVLAAGVAPLRRRRNLDVLALLSFVAPVVLLQHRYVDWSVVASLPGVAYLIARCMYAGLGSRRAEARATPLFLALTCNWDGSKQLRVLRMIVAALAFVVLAVGISSTGAVDVIYGVMEGATKLIHGALPYGHMPGDVVHGDTYPPLSYLFYTPVALVSPVSSTWDSVDTALGVAAISALVTALVLAKTATPRRPRPRALSVEAGEHAAAEPDLSSAAAGLLAALTWLSFPPLLITVSTGTTDVVLAGMLLIAVVLWQRPAASTAVLACAGWFKLAPFALVPIWLAPLRGRRLLGAAVAFAGVSAAMIAALVGIGGIGGLTAMTHAIGFQFERGSFQSMWATLGVSGLQPLGQACVLALIAGAAVRLRRAPDLFAERERVAALSAALLLALQLVADYWSFLYLAWIIPLVGMSLLAGPEPRAQRTPVVMHRRRAHRLAPGPAW